jgi:hypothetical protein
MEARHFGVLGTPLWCTLPGCVNVYVDPSISVRGYAGRNVQAYTHAKCFEIQLPRHPSRACLLCSHGREPWNVGLHPPCFSLILGRVRELIKLKGIAGVPTRRRRFRVSSRKLLELQCVAGIPAWRRGFRVATCKLREF